MPGNTKPRLLDSRSAALGSATSCRRATVPLAYPRNPQDIAYYSKVLFNTAVIYAIRGQHERAIADFARAITLDPFFAVAHFQLGVSAFLIGQMDEARKSFDRALSVRPPFVFDAGPFC